MTIDIGRVGIWTGALDGHPSTVAREAAQEIESLGYSTLWVPEAVGREPFVAAGVLLAATSSLKLATGIANIYARDPMTTVGAQMTLAEAFPGRFLLGLGVSHQHLVQNLRKHDYSRPLAYMKAYLTAMDEAMFAAVKPAEDPGRVLAALGPKMLELAATQANGSHPYFATAEHTAFCREAMGPDALLAPEQMVVLESDPARAREVARGAMAVYMRLPNYLNNLRRFGFGDEDWADYKNPSDRLVDAVVAWGDVETLAARVKAHHDAGADHVCVQVLRETVASPDAKWQELAPALGLTG